MLKELTTTPGRRSPLLHCGQWGRSEGSIVGGRVLFERREGFGSVVLDAERRASSAESMARRGWKGSSYWILVS